MSLVVPGVVWLVCLKRRYQVEAFCMREGEMRPAPTTVKFEELTIRMVNLLLPALN